MKKTIREDTVIMRVMCAVGFLIFSFLYLYNYQADILAMAQHVLSDGKTSYNDLVGAIVITITLYALHLVIYGIMKLHSIAHALTYFPSLLLLTVLTDVSPDIDNGFSFGNWLWAFPLLLCLWYVGVLVAKASMMYERPRVSHGFFSHTTWANSLAMAVMFFLVGCFSNSDEVFHYRMKIERCLVSGDYDKALDVGYSSLATDSSLTMLRVYALAACNELPERLFEYPLTGGAAAMKPNGTSVRMLLHEDVGLRKVRQSSYDYLLCGLLLDRKIDRFAHEVVKKYNAANMPRHYREALVMYKHIRANPIIVCKDNVMDADYRDYQDMEKKYHDVAERKNEIRDAYGKTYWYYYDYGEK